MHKTRLTGIDAARGAAMLLVCLAHFAYEYFAAPGAPEAHLLYAITMVASPTFMLISGIMLGLLYETRRDDFTHISRVFRSRGIFLLTVGHLLIVLACIPRMGLAQALTRGFITDVIGVAIIVGPWLMPRLGIRARLVAAAALYAAAFGLGWGWNPTQGFLDSIDYVLAGPDVGDTRLDFPLLSWSALYLLGTIVGTRLGLRLSRGDASGAERELVLTGSVAIACAVVIKGSYLVLRGIGALPAGVTTWYALTSVLQKFPPSLPYHLLYGGVGLGLIAVVLAAARRRLFPHAVEALATLGRASLFVFLLQFFVYYAGLHYLALPYSAWWPLLYVGSVLGLWMAAAGWLALDLNRVFDITRWFRPRRAFPLAAHQPGHSPPVPAVAVPVHSTP